MDADQYGELMSALARIEERQDALRQELLGNGQPGRIQRLEADVEKHEHHQWYHSGGVAVFNFIVHAIAAHFGFKG